MNRRHLFLGYISLTCLCCLGSRSQAQSQQSTGCFIQPLNQQVDSIRRNPELGEADGNESMLASLSRDSYQSENFDRELGVVLTEMVRHFDVKPGVGFWDDEIQPNAWFVPESWWPGTRGTIGIGRRLIRQHLSLDDQASSIVAICAHEFSHAYQQFSPYRDTIEQSPLGFSGLELHADYLAGTFIRRIRKERPGFPLYRVGEAWLAMRTAGFADASTHGSPRQRLRFIEQGYAEAEAQEDSNGHVNIATLAAKGLDFLRGELGY